MRKILPMPSSLLIKDVRIFDGEREIPSGSVLIQDGMICQVSDSQLGPPDASTTVISKPGHTLLPGFIDGHIHATQGTIEALTQSLKFGVTTVCDLHNEPEYLPALRKQASVDYDSSDFRSSCQGATIEDGWPGAIITAYDASKEARLPYELKFSTNTSRLKALARVNAWPKLKTQDDVKAYINNRLNDADYVKLFHEDAAALRMKLPVPSIELQKWVIEEAHDKGLMTVAHAFSLQSTIDILRAGADGMAHTIIDRPPTQELIDAYKANNAHCNPTLVALASITNEGLKEQEKYANDPRAQRFLTETAKGTMCHCVAVSSDDARVEYAYQSVRMMKEAGIDIILGTDTTSTVGGLAFGISAHHELAMLVARCGLTPIEALRAGTSVVARRFGLWDRGRIAGGLAADLVLVEGNPLEDIDDTLNLRAVWRQGVLCSAYAI